jgi:uncharacterized membrane protein
MTDSPIPPHDPNDPSDPTPPPPTPPSAPAPPPPPPPGYGTPYPPPPAPGYGYPPPTAPGYGTPPPPPPGYYGTPYPRPPDGAPVPGGPGGYSVGNAFGYGWTKFTKNLGPILIAMVAIAVLVFVIQLISSAVTEGMSAAGRMTYDPDTGRLEGGAAGAGFLTAALFVSLLFSVFSMIVSMVIQAAITRGALDLTYGRALALGQMFSNVNWVQVVLASILVSIATFIGLVLCILPGIAVLFLTSFTLFFVVDKNLGAVDAIKASVNLVAKNFGVLLLFFLACLAAYVVGALLCLVGLIVAVPVVIIAQAYTYRTLLGEQVAA